MGRPGADHELAPRGPCDDPCELADVCRLGLACRAFEVFVMYGGRRPWSGESRVPSRARYGELMDGDTPNTRSLTDRERRRIDRVRERELRERDPERIRARQQRYNERHPGRARDSWQRYRIRTTIEQVDAELAEKRRDGPAAAAPSAARRDRERGV